MMTVRIVRTSLNYVILLLLVFPEAIIFDLPSFRDIWESSGQTKQFVPPRESNIDFDDIGRTAQLGEGMFALVSIAVFTAKGTLDEG